MLLISQKPDTEARFYVDLLFSARVLEVWDSPLVSFLWQQQVSPTISGAPHVDNRAPTILAMAVLMPLLDRRAWIGISEVCLQIPSLFSF